MAYTKWSDIREEHIERIGRETFEAGKEQMLAEARGWPLVSQIETGKVSTRDVLDRYVEALGGRPSLTFTLLDGYAITDLPLPADAANGVVLVETGSPSGVALARPASLAQGHAAWPLPSAPPRTSRHAVRPA